MNPNFMRNMSPEQMQNNLNMMNPEMMKNVSSMMAGMSDSQIQMYLNQMGMGGMDPSMFRNMCQNMSNMNDSQFNSMKNMAQANINNMSNNYNNYNNTSNVNTNDNKYKGTIVQEVTKIKEEGNNLFRSGKYEEAIKKYYEGIEEIKTAIDKEKYKNELNELENTCRLNIANCKLKTKDYDGVINECSIVLENKKCFKAYCRMGIALLNKNKYEKAYRYLDNANAIGTSSEKQYVEPHLKECKEKLDEQRKKEREEKLKKEKEEKKEDIKEEKKEDKKEEMKEKEEKKEKKEEKKEKEEKNVKEEKKENNDKKININKEEKKENEIKEEEKKNEENEILIEDSTDNKKNNNINNNSSNSFPNTNYNNNYNFHGNPPNLSQDYINQARNQLNNMSDDQMNFMINQMKNMDNQTLKNMLSAQGMNITDQQIDMMKMTLTPETFKMMRDQNFHPPNMGNAFNNNINNGNNANNNSNNNVNNSMPQQMPNFANMDFNQMLDFIKKNPELLKMVSPQLSKMMGGKDIDPAIMMKSMEKIMWIFGLPGRIKRFMLSWRGICFIVFIIAIIYGLFFRK